MEQGLGNYLDNIDYVHWLPPYCSWLLEQRLWANLLFGILRYFFSEQIISLGDHIHIKQYKNGDYIN